MSPAVDSSPTLTTDHCCNLLLDRPITLYTITPEGGTPFTATAVQLTLIKSTVVGTITPEASLLTDCHLILTVSWEQYQQVLEHALFHLKPEVRGPLQQTDFQPEQPILLELGLQPHFLTPSPKPPAKTQNNTQDDEAAIATQLTELLTHLETPHEQPIEPDNLANDFLQTLLAQPANPTAPSNAISAPTASPNACPNTIAPWLQTDSWLCRSVQQQQPDGTVGYATLWAYTTPEQTDSVITSGTNALDAIATLLQKTTNTVKADIEQELPHLKQSLSQFSEDLVTTLEQVDWATLLANADQTLTQPAPPVSTIVKQFFDEDNWPYVQLPDSTTLQLAFQGDSGRWPCLAQSDDDAQQILFYSICPITIATEHYGTITELLMRANDGLIIGNFELNFATGEIRYKTSLDVEGDRLTPTLMQSLVYINVHTMDLYLPSIMAVLGGECSPGEAIEAIEEGEGS